MASKGNHLIYRFSGLEAIEFLFLENNVVIQTLEFKRELFHVLAFRLLRIGNNEIKMDPSPRKEWQPLRITARRDGENTALLCKKDISSKTSILFP